MFELKTLLERHIYTTNTPLLEEFALNVASEIAKILAREKGSASLLYRDVAFDITRVAISRAFQVFLNVLSKELSELISQIK